MSKTQAVDSGEAGGTPRIEDRNLFHLGMVIVFGFFATTLPQPQALGRLPLTFFLKDNLHQPAGKVSFFFLACGLFWYIKPLAGILTDAFPIFGTRRRHYMLISSALAALSWILLFMLPRTYNALLFGAIVVNLFMVMASTATGAFLVEAGQSMGATGRLTSIRIFVQNVCTVMQGYAGGLLANAGLLWTTRANAMIVFSLFPITYIFLKETRTRRTNSEAFSSAAAQLRTIRRSKAVWWTLVFVFLFYFSPGFSTLLTFRQSNDLHMAKSFIGLMGTVGGVGGLIAAVAYGFVIKRYQIRPLLYLGIVLASFSSVIYLLYNSQGVAPAIDFTNGVCYTFAEVALMDLMARSTPVGSEGLGYGLALSVRNLGIYLADFVGSSLSDKYHLPFSVMVWVNTLTTLAVIVLLPFIPNSIMATRDKSATDILIDTETEMGSVRKHSS